MVNPNEPDLGEVMVPTEEAHPDRREHAKQPKHVDEEELERRTEYEREIVDAERPSQGRI
jgi:hypothetical protein